LWQLVQKYGSDDVASLEELQARFRFRDFPHFIETWVWKNQFLREYEDFTVIANAVAADLDAQNVRYAEVFFSPGDFARHGLAVQPLAQAIRQGLDLQPRRLQVQLIGDLIRDFGPTQGARWLEALAEVRDAGIIGIGMGGSEHEYPAEAWGAVYERARALGFRTTAHAGEAAGADSVWAALRVLHVDRIGHGTRAAEEPALVRYLKDKGVPLEMCPLSNVATKVVPDLARHPIASWFRQGLQVTVNTDDPCMFGNCLESEYTALMQVHGLSLDDVRSLVDNAIRAAWCDEATRTRLRQELYSG
jgi:adenosine deaminase